MVDEEAITHVWQETHGRGVLGDMVQCRACRKMTSLDFGMVIARDLCSTTSILKGETDNNNRLRS